jgi:LPXTG-motif cell wall-anchored protein
VLRTAAGGPTAPELPRTGSTTLPIALSGAALIALGAVALVIGNRRPAPTQR